MLLYRLFAFDFRFALAIELNMTLWVYDILTPLTFSFHLQSQQQHQQQQMIEMPPILICNGKASDLRHYINARDSKYGLLHLPRADFDSSIFSSKCLVSRFGDVYHKDSQIYHISNVGVAWFMAWLSGLCSLMQVIWNVKCLLQSPTDELFRMCIWGIRFVIIFCHQFSELLKCQHSMQKFARQQSENRSKWQHWKWNRDSKAFKPLFKATTKDAIWINMRK